MGYSPEFHRELSFEYIMGMFLKYSTNMYFPGGEQLYSQIYTNKEQKEMLVLRKIHRLKLKLVLFLALVEL